MLAHAFLAAVAAAEHARQPAGPSLVPLTLAEIQHLMTPLASTTPPPPAIATAGHTGAGDTKPTPAPATTSSNPPENNEDHDLPLEY